MLARFAGAKLFFLVVGATSLCLGACASRPKPVAARPKPTAPPAPAKKLAWLPVDALEAPDVAKAMNEQLAQIKIAGASESVKSAVSLEVAQLALECTDPTPDCYRAVGRSLGADQMLWGELRRTPKKSIRVALALFDVREGTPPKRVEKTFEGTEAARAGVGELVSTAFGPAGATP